MLGALLAAALAAGTAAAQEPAATASRVSELERRLDESARLIDALTHRVVDLEARLAQGSPARDAAGPQPVEAADRIAAVERTVEEIAAARNAETDTGLRVHGFADVGAGTRSTLDPDRKGFTVGSLDLYLTPELGARTTALVELNFEAEETGGLAADLERLQLGYQLGDSTKLWVGRFHTPYGYYNNAFHHGQQIATSLRRPKFLAFEDQGGVMPAHTVGLWLNGSRRFGGGRFTYDAFVGNAQEIHEGVIDMVQGGKLRSDATVGGNVGFQLGKTDGFTVGLSYFGANVEDDALTPNRTRVNNYGAYAVLDNDRWEIISEVYRFADDDLSAGGASHGSTAGFAQAARRLGRFAPYARYEHAAFDQTDPFFAAQQSGVSYRRGALGVRFELALPSALKLELGRTIETDRFRNEFSDALFQYAIRF
jgi:hypothetical protein